MNKKLLALALCAIMILSMVCVSAGAACAHANTGTFINPVGEREYTSIDNFTHQFTEERYEGSYCMDCGEILSEEYMGEVTVEESHEYEDDQCVSCYHVYTACSHESTRGQTMTSGVTYEQVDETYHNRICEEKSRATICNDCEEIIAMEVIGTNVVEQQTHIFNNDVCVSCGYVKVVATATPEPVVTATPEPVVTATPEPVVTATPEPVVTATPEPVVTATPEPVVTATPEPVVTATPEPVVTATPEPVVTPAPTAAPESDRTEMDRIGWITGDVVNVRAGAGMEYEKLGVVYFGNSRHVVAKVEDASGATWYEVEFNDGIGYVHGGLITFSGKPVKETPKPTAKPAAKPTAAPTAEPTVEPTVEPTAEPVVEPVIESAIDSALTEALAAEEKPMVEALTAVADALAADEEITVQIANLDKIISADEKTALDALTVKEQVLVVLSAIGHADAVDAALNAPEAALTLSAEAQALADAITARIAAMNEDEKAAFDALLSEAFPVEEVELEDGTKVQCFYIELTVEKMGESRAERIAFRYDEETASWIFMKSEAAALTEDTAA